MNFRYVFIDESGDLGTSYKTDPFFAVVAIVADKAETRHIQKNMWRVNSRLGLAKGQEIKAALAADEVRMRVLRTLDACSFQINAVIFNKRAHATRPPAHRDEIYRSGVCEVVSMCAIPGIRMCVEIDRREVGRHKEQLNARVQAELTKVHVLDSVVVQGNSKESLHLQAVDYIAWCIHRKYALSGREDASLHYDIIRSKVRNERLCSK